jgi:gamma-glutamylcyclotransferase (GGCT)/AIG2-like uncharacterized protein YtfP
MVECNTVFVYGTLKQHQLRGKMWPHSPITIRPAVLQAALYDLGPYPAIGPGEDWVLGEAWTLHNEHLQETIDVLDQIEGYQALGKNNEYTRILVEIVFDDGSLGRAHTYQFAGTDRLDQFRRIEPARPFCGRLSAAWPDPKSRVPQSIAEE